MALRFPPDYAEAYNDRGHSHYWTGEHAKAIADFSRASRITADGGAAYMANDGSRACAIADFDAGLAVSHMTRNRHTAEVAVSVISPGLCVNGS